MRLGKLDIYMQKNQTELLSHTIHKSKLKMDLRYEWKTWNYKIPRGKKKVCSTHFDIGFNNISLAMSLQARGTKAIINKWNYRKLESTAKETITKMKSPPNKWEKIFGNNIWWGVNIQTMQIVHTDQYQKTKQSNWKRGRGPEQAVFPKKDIQMANRHLKILNIPHHQQNTNQYYEISLYTC